MYTNGPEVAVGAATVVLVLAPILTVVFPPPLILYVTVTGRAIGFVKVTFGIAAFWQTVVVPLIDAVGVGRTVIVAEPASAFVHEGAAW